MTGSANHWDLVYATKEAQDLSWYQAAAGVSLSLIDKFAPAGAFIDVGAGASVLADQLLASDRADLTLLDLSAEGLDAAQRRLGAGAAAMTFIVADILTWQPPRTYGVWHDRAVFHFLTDPRDRATYVRTATTAVQAGGVIVLGTFAEDGPGQCSGLPVARYDAATLADQFAAGFSVEEAFREVHQTPWGSTQPFTWVVLRRLA